MRVLSRNSGGAHKRAALLVIGIESPAGVIRRGCVDISQTLTSSRPLHACPGWVNTIVLRRNSDALVEAVMDQLFLAYLPIAVFIAVSLFIAVALTSASFLIAVRNPDPEKVSAYECGFNAFDDARMKFDVRFYLVAILFIIFDLEVAFLFPWAVAFKGVGVFGFWAMMIFLGVLTVGFIYEWRKGALEWD